MARLLIAMPQMRQAASPKLGGGPKTALDHIRLAPSDNGGFSVEHHFQGGMRQPATYSFGAGQGQDMLNHVAKAMKVRPPAAPVASTK